LKQKNNPTTSNSKRCRYGDTGSFARLKDDYINTKHSNSRISKVVLGSKHNSFLF